MRTLYLPGVTIAGWPNVAVWQGDRDVFADITGWWEWSTTPHQHYEVAVFPGGSYWVPVSTHPPAIWDGYTPVVGSTPPGRQPVNRLGSEYRPDTTYIWIPATSIPADIVPGQTSNHVVCGVPRSYPPNQLGRPPASVPASAAYQLTDQNRKEPSMPHRKEPSVALAAATPQQAALEAILNPPANPQAPFQDSDGLISFVNLSSSFVQNNPQFPVGQAVCDQVSNFIATLRTKTYTALTTKAVPLLPGDTMPTTIWDSAVTHYMFYLLTEEGGLTSFRITNETYSVSQVIMEFSTAFVKIIFDAAVVPEALITDVASFIGGVGDSLRFSWDNRSRHYEVTLLGQCHEAVPIDNSGQDYRYFPKIKYYHLTIDSSQTEFTTPCTSTQVITFNFSYEQYVTALDASLLDKTSTLYQSFTAFLANAQGVNHKDAQNNLDKILGNTPSAALEGIEGANVFGVDLTQYPRTAVAPPPMIQSVLNTR